MSESDHLSRDSEISIVYRVQYILYCSLLQKWVFLCFFGLFSCDKSINASLSRAIWDLFCSSFFFRLFALVLRAHANNFEKKNDLQNKSHIALWRMRWYILIARECNNEQNFYCLQSAIYFILHSSAIMSFCLSYVNQEKRWGNQVDWGTKTRSKTNIFDAYYY